MQAVAAALDAVSPMLGQRPRVLPPPPGAVIASSRGAAGARADQDGHARRRARPRRCAHAGVAEPEASLAAEAGIATFRVAWAQWLSATEDRDLAEVMRESLSRLEALVGKR